ncbi:MAG: ABC transporter permease, partial [Sciscionella sp.]|nr:ABC transporter permease [Sciscionella sp.]
MSNLIKAEFRKILSTKLWWGLLIPTVLLAFFMAFGIGLLAAKFGDDLSSEEVLSKSGISVKDLALGVFALSRGINIASIFPMIFGALGLSSELRHRTITTSFLTAPNRPALLGAKAVTYTLWGLIYGLVIAAFASLGTVAGTGGDYLPDAGGFLL